MTKKAFLDHKELIKFILIHTQSTLSITVKTKNRDDFDNYDYFCVNSNGYASIVSERPAQYISQILTNVWSGSEEVEVFLQDSSNYFFRGFGAKKETYLPIIVNNTNAIWKF